MRYVKEHLKVLEEDVRVDEVQARHLNLEALSLLASC